MAGQTSASDCSHLIDHSHVPEFEVALWIKITLALVYICLFVAGILGNSITIKATRILQKKGYLQKEVTDHMVSLACSDLLVILLGMPVEFFSAIWSPFSAPNGNIACKLYYFLFEACSYATVLHVATLSFERYIAICHPFKFKSLSGPRTVKLLIAFVWGTSVIVALPLLFAMGTEYPLETIEGYQRTTACVKPTPRHYLPELKYNMTICTSLSSKWPLFQASIFSAFAVYIIVLGSVTFMCHSMMKALMIPKEGTVTVKGGEKHQKKYLRKSESSEGKSSRRQIIFFLVVAKDFTETLVSAIEGKTVPVSKSKIKRSGQKIINLVALDSSGTPSIFINDTDEGVGCTLNTFADDTKLNGVVGAPEGLDAIHRDVGKLEKWAHGNLMRFNMAK
ncbi:G-protein coupled receptor 39 [Willisornis vidua]|uniref:G-protein coupled receptor 39 n=1 Tax=Willisornis vidua TaxID=1566151 RepID=A0ABQ9CQV9_9PASS|nr:G-protein coupled receptor 39 [Willisornis vidua]